MFPSRPATGCVLIPPPEYAEDPAFEDGYVYTSRFPVEPNPTRSPGLMSFEAAILNTARRMLLRSPTVAAPDQNDGDNQQHINQANQNEGDRVPEDDNPEHVI